MAELVERDWAMKEIKFWENRAKYYRDMIFDLMAKMMKDVKFNSVEWTADGIAWKEKQSGWIPVSERLPKEGELVLLCFRYEKDSPAWSIQVGHLGVHDVEDHNFQKIGVAQVWYTDRFYWTFDQVTAWMPLPKPYKEDEK